MLNSTLDRQEAFTKMKIGLALGGGGARGLAHIGVLKVLENRGIKPACITGSSIGAIVGGMYAWLHDADVLEEKAFEFLNSPLFKQVGIDFFNRSRSKTGGVRNEHLWSKIRLRISFLKTIKSPSIISSRQTEKLFAFIPHISIEELAIPFSAIATDIISGEEIVLDRGDLKTAVKASAAIPGVFPPVQLDNYLLLDGGASDSIPVHVVKQRGADFIIAVDVTHCIRKMKKISNALSIIHRIDDITTFHLTQERLAGSDFIIQPTVRDINWYEFDRADEIIKLGEKAAEQALSRLYKLLAEPFAK